MYIYILTHSSLTIPNITSSSPFYFPPKFSMRLISLSNKLKPLFHSHRCHVTTPQMDRRRTRKPKLLVIMGPTGSGKSKLSIDLVTRFLPGSEIINSDKIQLYRGLDITTNKMPMPDRRGVPHHLLGVADPNIEFPPLAFRSAASAAVAAISRSRRLPILVGGSNSIIYSLLSKRFDPGSDVFHQAQPDPISTKLRFDCCFLYVDVAMPVLDEYLVKRVDDMLDSGMFTELTQWFKTERFSDSVSRVGLRKAIGVPEFEPYFRRYLFAGGDMGNDPVRRGAYEEAVRGIKDNTCQLARRQVEKIQRLREGAGWELNRLDATAAFKATLSGGDVAGIWERQVVEPSVEIVKRFFEE